MFDPRNPEKTMWLEEKALEKETRELTANLSAATARLVCLVDRIDKDETWRRHHGCNSASHWLQWQCGITPHAANEYLACARGLRELPTLKEAFCKGELSFSQVRALVRIATPATEADLVELARVMTAGQLVRFVRVYNKVKAMESPAAARHFLTTYFDDDGDYVISGRLTPEVGAVVEAALKAARAELRKAVPEYHQEQHRVLNADALEHVAEAALASHASRSGDDAYQVVLNVDAAALKDPSKAWDSDVLCEIEPGVGVPKETALRLSCDCSIVAVITMGDEVIYSSKKSRHIPRRIRRAAKARDKGCRWPGCTNTRFVDLHHVLHWGHHGPHEIFNLVTLCKYHHKLVHEGGFAVETHPGGNFSFHKPNGEIVSEVIEPARPGDLSLEEMNMAEALAIDDQTCVPRWEGDPLTPYAMDVVLQHHHDWNSRPRATTLPDESY